LSLCLLSACLGSCSGTIYLDEVDSGIELDSGIEFDSGQPEDAGDLPADEAGDESPVDAADGGDGPVNPDLGLPPTVTLLVNNQEDPPPAPYNTTATVSWTSTNASACELNPGAHTGLSGSLTTPGLTEDTTYSISCINESGLTADAAVVIPVYPQCEWPEGEGFAYDLLVDGGVDLSDVEPTAAEFLGLRYWSLFTESESYQNQFLVGSDEDLNGVLLYPDNAPRYRMVYVNGGSSGHGCTLGAEGRQRFRTFFENGGSYTGSCAGAYMVNTGSQCHLDLWDGWFESDTPWGVTLSVVFTEVDHPLVMALEELAGTTTIDDISHYGGPLYQPSDSDPPGTEYLGTITNVHGVLEGAPSIMAYKPTLDSGRLVVHASHPEYASGGTRRDLMAATFLYALAGGLKLPFHKGELQNSEPVVMNQDETRVGDEQYHRWTLDIPPGTTTLEITARGISEDVDLYVSYGCPSHRDTHDYSSAQSGPGDEYILIADPSRGIWHVSVFGSHDLWNGSSYELVADWR